MANRLTRLHIKNFRCLADVEIDVRPINVLFGPNGSGKSTLLDAVYKQHGSASNYYTKRRDQRRNDESGQAILTRVSEIEEVKDLLEDYAAGSLYMAEAIAPQSHLQS